MRGRLQAMAAGLAAALAAAPVAAQPLSLPPPPPGCESAQADRLVAGGPMRQPLAVELLRCAGEYRMRLLRVDPPERAELLAQQFLGPAATGATIELAGGACLMGGKPVTRNLAIHGQWGKRRVIRFGSGLLGAWLPDEAGGTIRALTPADRLVCQADRP